MRTDASRVSRTKTTIPTHCNSGKHRPDSDRSHGVVYGASEPDQFDTVQPLGQILIARFFDESALTLHRDGLYRPTPAAGSMSRFAAGKQPQVLQAGALERSNVNGRLRNKR